MNAISIFFAALFVLLLLLGMKILSQILWTLKKGVRIDGTVCELVIEVKNKKGGTYRLAVNSGTGDDTVCRVTQTEINVSDRQGDMDDKKANWIGRAVTVIACDKPPKLISGKPLSYIAGMLHKDVLLAVGVMICGTAGLILMFAAM